MKASHYILSGVIALLAILLLRTGCQAPQVVEVVKWVTIDLDSLKATMPPDTVVIPGKQIVKYVPIKVSTSDPRVIDSMVNAYREMEAHYNSMANNLITGWDWQTDEVTINTKAHIYEDSVSTPTYFHRWLIEAEGPITSYRFGVQPICIPCPEVAPPAKKLHRVGLFAGGQTMPGGLRPVVGAGYGYGPIRLQAGVLPAAQGARTEGQILLGLEIGLK